MTLYLLRAYIVEGVSINVLESEVPCSKLILKKLCCYNT